MKKKDKLFLLKYFLNIFNGIFLILGVMLVVFGVWITTDSNTFFTLLLSSGGDSSVAPIFQVLLVIGSFIILAGILGYLGSLHEIRSLVVMLSKVQRMHFLPRFTSMTQYMGLLILALIIQATVFLLLNTGKDMIFNLWTVQLGELISSYGDKNLPGKKHQWDILNNLQRTLHCCGRNNFTDWKGNKHKEHADQVPCSCTPSTTNKWFCDVVENATYIKGCEEDTRMWYKENTWMLISINAGLLLVEALQFVAAAWLFRLMKKTKILPMS